MTPYIRNRNCQCTRCRAHGLMGAAVLITLGILFLMDSYGTIRFDQGLPALLLVIGGVLLVARTGSTEGHIQPGWIAGPVVQPPAQAWPTTTTAGQRSYRRHCPDWPWSALPTPKPGHFPHSQPLAAVPDRRRHMACL